MLGLILGLALLGFVFINLSMAFKVSFAQPVLFTLGFAFLLVAVASLAYDSLDASLLNIIFGPGIVIMLGMFFALMVAYAMGLGAYYYKHGGLRA